MRNLLTLKNVADLRNVKPYRIGYVLSVKLVPEPALRIGNNRVFSQDDLVRLAAQGSRVARGDGSNPTQHVSQVGPSEKRQNTSLFSGAKSRRFPS